MAGQTSMDYANVSRWPVLIAVDAMTRPAGVAVNRPVCIVGAPGRAHLKIDSKQISKTHALIIQETGGVYVRDLCSTNKTLVNGKPVREAWLKNHDIIRFGTIAYRCQSGFTNRVAPALAPAGELHFVDEAGEPRLQPVEQQTFLIGSRAGCDLVLGGEDIAKAHAILFSRDAKRFILDLTGELKTLVNESPVREAELQPGDTIQIGEYRFAYYLAGETIAPAATEEQIAKEVLEIPEPEAVAPTIEEKSHVVEPPIVAEEPAEVAQQIIPEEAATIESPKIQSPEPAAQQDDLIVDSELALDSAPVTDELEIAAEVHLPAEEPAAAELEVAAEAHLLAEEPAAVELPAAPAPQVPAMATAAVAPTPALAQSEPDHLRHEPLLLKSAVAFPVFAEKKPEGQLELTLDGDVLTGTLKRPAEPPKLFPRANKRQPITNRDQLLSQSFVVKK